MLIAFCIVLLMYMGPLDDATALSQLPILLILGKITGSAVCANILVSCIAVINFLCLFNYFASVSRLVWVFARDNGLPFSPFFAYVSHFSFPTRCDSDSRHETSPYLLFLATPWLIAIRCTPRSNFPSMLLRSLAPLSPASPSSTSPVLPPSTHLSLSRLLPSPPRTSCPSSSWCSVKFVAHLRPTDHGRLENWAFPSTLERLCTCSSSCHGCHCHHSYLLLKTT